MAKKALMLLVVAFAVFFLLARPERAADVVQTLGGMAGEALHAVARFFTTLID